LIRNAPSCPVRSSGAFIVNTLSIYWKRHHMEENTFVIGATKLATVLFTIALSVSLILISNVLFNRVFWKLIVRHINLPTRIIH
jgi:hypothetical protein